MHFKASKYWLFVAAAASVLVSAGAWAQQVLRMEELTIEGEVQKPQASYILQRSGKVDLGVDVRSFKPEMSSGYRDILDRRPELFDTRRR